MDEAIIDYVSRAAAEVRQCSGVLLGDIEGTITIAPFSISEKYPEASLHLD